MIFDDETNPASRKPQPRNLEKMSIAELATYITDLHAEVARAEGEKAKKEKLKSAADSLFKT